MASSKKIRPEQLTRARKLLHDLPEKEDGKTRPEAAEFLESDFRKALAKGYSPKELSQLLKNEGIIIPAYLIKRYFRETADAPRQKKSQASAQKTAPAKQSFVVPDLPDEGVMSMNASIFYVGGSKGGVGKSKLAFALIDYLLDEEKQVVLLETDTSNPDVFKAHQPHENDRLICKEADLDSADGWIELVNAADEFPNHYLVINSAARSNIGLAKYGATLRETLAELDRNLLTFWIINRQRDSIELLRGFLNVFPDALVHVCRNLYFGEPEKFERYNSSKSRELIERKGQTLDFPDLGDRVADKLYSGRMSIRKALTELPIGDRAELRRWKIACAEMFRKALNVEE